jgi:hypothetical protein
MSDPIMDRIMDTDNPPPCRCDRGCPCVRPAIPGDLLCAGCIAYCVPLAQGRSPWTGEAG